MNKQVTVVAIIAFLFILCIVPIVSAIPQRQTLTVSEGRGVSVVVDLRQGDHVALNVTVLWDTNNPDIRSQCVNVSINNENGDKFGEYSIRYRENLGTQVYSFDAPVKADYAIQFSDASNPPSSDEKAVQIDYNITHTMGEPLSNQTIVILTFLAILSIVVVGFVVANTLLKRPSIVSKFDAMLTKKTSEIPNIKDNANGHLEAQKQEVILRCNNAWLTQSQLYCNRTFYQVSEITKAWVDYRDYLSIQLNDGLTAYCKLMPDAASEEAINKVAFLNQQTAEEAFKSYMHTRTEEWVETINALITKRIKLETVVCEHCGAKNKINDAKCFHCGAILH